MGWYVGKVLEKDQPRFLHLARLSFRNERETHTFPGK
jgi:hypothetical protein